MSFLFFLFCQMISYLGYSFLITKTVRTGRITAMGASFTGLRAMFYLLLPSETYYERVEDVPNYIVKVVRLFLALQVLEFAIAWYRGKIKPRFNDTFSSITAGIVSRMPQFFVRSIELSAYIWVYEHVHIFPRFSWNSPLTYWIAFIGVDFGYYWFHRMSHEVNLFWATHQTHHSAENYNLSTALRQGVLQPYFAWILYLPLALILPPQIFLIHSQMNTLYQFWIHTDMISNLGPFEYILNTPSHHRVHHGRNPYCIDKNYGGVLIIWDRLFGTFAAERENEEIAYGLLHPISTFDPIETQFGHLKYMFQQFFQVKGWQNKLAIIWKGPGWQPGLPRLGNDDFPQINYPIRVYHPNVSTELSAYTFVHFLYVTVQYSAVLTNSKNHSILALFLYTIIILFTLTIFGAIFDQKKYALHLERIRLILMLILPQLIIMKSLFLLQTHLITQILIVLSFIATFFIAPIPSSEKNFSKKIK